MRLAALIAALGLAAAPALAETGGLFVVIYKAGPAWQAGKPMSQQGLGPHAAYIKSLLDDGRLVAGGPTTGDSGLAIIRVASAEEAKKVLAADPAITGRIFTAELLPWSPQYTSDKPIGR